MKTLAIRLEEELHTQLTLLAQLEGLSLQDALKAAVVSYVATKASAPELSAKAEAVMAEVEREAEARRAAISALFAANQPPATDTASAGRRAKAKGATQPPIEQ